MKTSIREKMKHKIIIKKQQKKTTLIVNGLRNGRSTKEKKYYLESYQNYIQLKIKNKNHSKQNHIWTRELCGPK